MEENPSQSAITAAVSLWMLTAVLGLWVMAAILQDIMPRLFAILAFSKGFYEVIYNLLALVLAIIWIVVVVGGAEYHRTRIGHPRSWQLFGWTLGVEAAVLLVATVL